MSNDQTEVVLRRDGRVTTITLDRPAEQNRLTRSVLLALQGIVDELAGDGHVQAVLVTGRGSQVFSMGIELIRAGAAELSLACDIRLAASHATWALPEALWGGAPGAGGPVRLPALVGRTRYALEWSHDIDEGAAAHREGQTPRFTAR